MFGYIFNISQLFSFFQIFQQRKLLSQKEKKYSNEMKWKNALTNKFREIVKKKTNERKERKTRITHAPNEYISIWKRNDYSYHSQ